MAVLTARPTTYNGVQMRSRLEARYASWMDLVGIRWTYEPRCFASPVGQYLPDFELHEIITLNEGAPVFVEVKPTWEMARGVRERMQVIWASEPAAVLVLEVARDTDGPLIVLPDTGSWACGAWSRIAPHHPVALSFNMRRSWAGGY